MNDPNPRPDDESDELSDEELRLNAVLRPYLDADPVARPDRGALFQAHPDLADALRAFFADYDRLHALIGPRPPADSAPVGGETVDLPGSAVAETDHDGLIAPAPGLDETVASDSGDFDRPDPSAGAIVRYFGDYVLLNELGRGGMGVVYKARQVSLNRAVALKMLRSGMAASEDDLRRFQTEAEAVAALDHPGIVPVHEVGEHHGHRYFSMKFVSGGSLAARLDDFAGRFDVAARLMVAVCDAVHHAHQRGILHRDLKPANILLDEESRPLVTDFGLAKRVEVDSGLTQSGAILGTPSYMAPEQCSGRRGSVTTATDVYGLGAILYVLLTKQPPFAGDSVIDTLEQLRTRPPEPPSRLNAKVPRDLEVICLKCLEKEPARRYASAAELGDDLARWADGRPIRARPVPALSRAAMWCRRNPVLATLSAALALALIAGVSGIAWKWRDAEHQKGLLAVANTQVTRERNAAIDARDESQSINHFLTEELLQQAAPENNARASKVTVEELLGRAADRIATAGMKPAVEAAVRDAIGRAYLSLDELAKADPHLVAALEIRRRVLGPDHPATLFSADRLGTLRQAQGRLPEAESLFRENLADRTRVLGADHEETGESLNNLGGLHLRQARYADAEPLLRRAHAIILRMHGEDDAKTLSVMMNLALANQYLGNFDETRPLLERGLATSMRVIGKDSPRTFDMANALARAYENQGDLDRAGKLYEQNVKDRERVQGKDHMDVFVARNNLMVLRRRQGRLDLAEPLARENYETLRSTLGPAQVNTLFAGNNLAIILYTGGKLADGEKLFREILKGRREVLPADSPDLADTLSHLGDLLILDHRPKEAEPLLDEAIAIFGKSLPATHPRRLMAEIRRGLCLADLGRFEDAEAILIRGYESLPPGKGKVLIERSRVKDRIIRLYDAWGRADKASEWRAKADESGPATPGSGK